MNLLSDERDDPAAKAEVDAYDRWMTTIGEWRDTGPVVADSVSDGVRYVRLESDESGDPLVYAEKVVDMLDPATYTPVRRSEVADPVILEDGDRWENMLAWYGDTIDPGFDQGPWSGGAPPLLDLPMPD